MSTTTKRHMSLNIEGVLKWKNLKGILQDENGHELSHEQVEEYLSQCKAKGWKKIPIGDCEGFDYITGCPGHKMEK